MNLIVLRISLLFSIKWSIHLNPIVSPLEKWKAFKFIIEIYWNDCKHFLNRFLISIFIGEDQSMNLIHVEQKFGWDQRLTEININNYGFKRNIGRKRNMLQTKMILSVF